MISLSERYKKEAIPKLMETLGVHHPLAVPKIAKVTVSAGTGKIAPDAKAVEEVTQTLTLVTGQKPKVTRARKAIASFKVRQDAPVGLAVTLRGKRMQDFLERLVNTVLPRIRDFRGLSPSSFDANGNFSLGISEQIVFPEVSPESVHTLHGLEITISTTAKNPQEGQVLLSSLGFPFKKGEE